MKIPDDYLEYLRSCKQTDGELSIDPGWYQLWPENELEELNEESKKTRIKNQNKS